MAKSEYKNAIRSKNLIRKYFLEILIETGDINKVSVTEIVKRAGINRGTFYAHFSDIYEVEYNISTGYLQQIKKLLNDHYDNPKEIITVLNNFFMQNELLFKNIYSIYGSNGFTTQFKDAIVEAMMSHVRSNNPQDLQKAIFDANFLAYGVVGIYNEWFSGKLKCTLNELTELFDSQIFNANFFRNADFFEFKSR